MKNENEPDIQREDLPPWMRPPEGPGRYFEVHLRPLVIRALDPLDAVSRAFEIWATRFICVAAEGGNGGDYIVVPTYEGVGPALPQGYRLSPELRAITVEGEASEELRAMMAAKSLMQTVESAREHRKKREERERRKAQGEPEGPAPSPN